MKNRLRSVLQHSVSRNAMALFIMQVANYLVPWLVLPYLTRVLGVKDFGIVAIVLASIQFAYVLTDYGFSLSATYTIAKERDNREKIASLIGAIFGAKLFLVLLACTGVLLFPYFTQYHTHKALFNMALLAIIAQAFQPIWFFQGIECMKNITIYMVATKLLYAVLVLVFVHDTMDGIWVIFSWGLAQSVGTMISVRQIYSEGYQIRFPESREIRRVLREGSHFFWSRIAVAIYTTASTVIVGASGNAAAAGQFAVCQKLYMAGQNMTAPINSVLYPYMAANKDWRLFFRIFFILGFLVALSCIVASFYAKEILTLLFGAGYSSASPTLLVFLALTVVNYIGVNFGYPAFAALGNVKFANTSVLIGSSLYILLLSILIFNGIASAFSIAFTILITEFFVMILRVTKFLTLRRDKEMN